MVVLSHTPAVLSMVRAGSQEECGSWLGAPKQSGHGASICLTWCGQAVFAPYLKVGHLQQPHIRRQPVSRLDCDNVTRDQLVRIECDALAVTEHVGCVLTRSVGRAR